MSLPSSVSGAQAPAPSVAVFLAQPLIGFSSRNCHFADCSDLKISPLHTKNSSTWYFSVDALANTKPPSPSLWDCIRHCPLATTPQIAHRPFLTPRRIHPSAEEMDLRWALLLSMSVRGSTCANVELCQSVTTI